MATDLPENKGSNNRAQDLVRKQFAIFIEITIVFDSPNPTNMGKSYFSTFSMPVYKFFAEA